MSSYGKYTSEKPKAVESDSSPGPIKPIGTPYVSSGHSIGDPHSKQAKGEASVTSGLTKLSGKTAVSSGVFIGEPRSKNPNDTIIHSSKTGVSSGVRGKAAVSSSVRGKAIVSTELVAFKDVKYGSHDGELRFRLIHFWEARNVVSKVLLGLEMLFIDQEETVIQGFIPAGRIDTYLPRLRVGGLYRLNSFYGSNNKTLYRVAEPSFTVTFSSSSVLSDLMDSPVCFPEDRFRIHGYEEFDAACDLKGNLYDYVGHIKLVNGQVLSDSLMLDDAEIASSRRVLLHVQTHDDPVIKLYLWDKVASDFSEKFKATGGTARVVLVTTLDILHIYITCLGCILHTYVSIRYLSTTSSLWRHLGAFGAQKGVFRVVIGRARHGATSPERHHQVALTSLLERPYQSDREKSLAVSSLGDARTSPERPPGATSRSDTTKSLASHAPLGATSQSDTPRSLASLWRDDTKRSLERPLRATH
ncbi:hypothetical protein IGI04_016629 [Brassica rapa subsp. trilocularis]|uniref:DUF223 domain-containing protein n=1 Tax=Brassica rapa subsp. trilocularis TaxID=1813537 RepID=A0ABQ7MTM2_BRACM|nr:hypothetical protein IGI04_016629 [Brassica rapa subsp. trilocularis]